MRLTCLLLTLAVPSVSFADFDYIDFASLDGLALVEDAVQDGNEILLTPSVLSQKGALWTDTPQSVGAGFTTTFQFQHVAASGGADGSAFVIQNFAVDALGNHASALGYGGFLGSPDEGIPFSVAVEFDDFANGNYGDPSGNHVSVHTNGADANSSHHDFSLGSSSNIPALAGIHTARVTYTPGTMTIFIDDMLNPVLTVDIDLAAQIGGDSAFIGFTAATGGIVEEHRVLSWSFESAAGAQDFVRGDFDGDGEFNGLIDALASLSFQFQAGAPAPCTEASDADGSGDYNGLVDVLFTLAHQFQGGAPPPAPYPLCGADPDPQTSLGCGANACP